MRCDATSQDERWNLRRKARCESDPATGAIGEERVSCVYVCGFASRVCVVRRWPKLCQNGPSLSGASERPKRTEEKSICWLEARAESDTQFARRLILAGCTEARAQTLDGWRASLARQASRLASRLVGQSNFVGSVALHLRASTSPKPLCAARAKSTLRSLCALYARALCDSVRAMRRVRGPKNCGTELFVIIALQSAKATTSTLFQQPNLL